jgi:hypothetical protein
MLEEQMRELDLDFKATKAQASRSMHLPIDSSICRF